jgi:hypothetical protein
MPKSDKSTKTSRTFEMAGLTTVTGLEKISSGEPGPLTDELVDTQAERRLLRKIDLCEFNRFYFYSFFVSLIWRPNPEIVARLIRMNR